MKIDNVVTRMAPSPTGKFHIGSARTALFSYLFAKHNGGKFILRIEDTDKERSKKEYEENIIESFKWLGLDYDEFYRQSERTEIYKENIKKLIDSGHAYISNEEDQNIGVGEHVERITNRLKSVIRFKNPNKKIKFADEILGEIEFDTTDLKDFVIAKDLDTPLYHLTVVVDDGLMNVSHVIRAQEHIANTPRQILILEALGFKRPIYAHIPLVLAPDKTKLSKRHGAVALLDYRDEGYLPEAVLNFLAFLGWNPGTEQELFDPKELVESFSLEKVNKGGAVFNTEKLNWYNREYIKKMNTEEVLAEVKKYLDLQEDLLNRALPSIIERINKFSDLENTEEFGFYKNLPDYDPNILIWKKCDKEKTFAHLGKVKELLENGDYSSIDSIKNAVWDYAEAAGRGDVLWPTRVALSGKEKSPDPFTLAYIFGKNETLLRIEKALEKLG